MDYQLGVLAAAVAMLCWGVGDYLMQKSARRIGDWESLFYVSLFGAVFIFPFVYGQQAALAANWKELAILSVAAVLMIAAALLDFEALKDGKLSVTEPVFVIEIPVASLLAFFLIGEGISLVQIVLVGGLIAGLALVSLRSSHLRRKRWLEKGVVLALLGSIFMGATGFAFGAAARQTSALMVNWFVSIFLAVVCLAYLASRSRLSRVGIDWRKGTLSLLAFCASGVVAWIAFAYAAVLLPIAIAVSISQCYIVITVLLGIFVSHEKLMGHQKVGLVVSVVLAIALAAVSG